MDNRDGVKMSLEEALAYGVRLHQGGKMPQAEAIYRSILQMVPEQVETLNFLGVLLHQGGFTEEGVASLEKAIALSPDYVDAHNNLGNIFRAQKRTDEAIGCYRRALKLAPEHVDSLNNLGVLLKSRRRYEEAVEVLRRAIALAPERGDVYYNLGNVLDRLHKRDEAIAAYRRAIELMPTIVGAYDALARALLREGQHAKAREVYELLRENAPDNPIAPHMLAACSGEEVPARASDGYVQATFDGFSESFDTVLEGLEYQAPQRIAETMTAMLPPPGAQLDVLDAGCGTGLCGPLLRPYARRLVGVDLSAGMLARSHARGVYDGLLHGELTEYLEQHAEAFDLI
ncbi:MAG: tetratricopeptide repeat protein, partial [Planctomycetes bacterium]|nr:tetratricopeptide repeat protein [Planctomycetota bacterium]